MEALSTIVKRTEMGLAAIQPCSGELSLARRSGPSLPEGMGLALATLMDEVQARYPNQALLPSTVEMHLAQWEDLAMKFGMEAFRAALLRAVRESRFFPDPLDIEAHCAAAARERRERAEAQKLSDDLERWKAQCAAEAAEERERQPTEQELRLNELLRKTRQQKPRQYTVPPPVHTEAEVRAAIDAHITPEAHEAARQNREALEARMRGEATAA